MVFRMIYVWKKIDNFFSQTTKSISIIQSSFDADGPKLLTEKWKTKLCIILIFTHFYRSNFGSSYGSNDEEDNVEDLSGVCATTEWSGWSECSATCGDAIRRRSRDFRNKGVQKKCYHIKRGEFLILVIIYS